MKVRFFTTNNGLVYSAVDATSGGGGVDQASVEASANQQKANDAFGEAMDDAETAEQDTASLKKDGDSKQTQF